MPLSTSSSWTSPDDRPQPRRSDESADRERLIPFPSRGPSEFDARSANAANAARRRREGPDRERGGAPRARRRRSRAPWLQRNALSIAALSVLIALLGIGFGLVQVLTRSDPTQALLAFAPPEQPTATVAASNTLAANVVAVLPPPGTAPPPPRAIQASARVIEPNYTIERGDTLASIARQFNTTVERIQAFNTGLTDPRALRIGTKLVIPPPL
jgi:hypothetical protein